MLMAGWLLPLTTGYFLWWTLPRTKIGTPRGRRKSICFCFCLARAPKYLRSFGKQKQKSAVSLKFFYFNFFFYFGGRWNARHLVDVDIGRKKEYDGVKLKRQVIWVLTLSTAKQVISYANSIRPLLSFSGKLKSHSKWLFVLEECLLDKVERTVCGTFFKKWNQS